MENHRPNQHQSENRVNSFEYHERKHNQKNHHHHNQNNHHHNKNNHHYNQNYNQNHHHNQTHHHHHQNHHHHYQNHHHHNQHDHHIQNHHHNQNHHRNQNHHNHNNYHHHNQPNTFWKRKDVPQDDRNNDSGNAVTSNNGALESPCHETELWKKPNKACRTYHNNVQCVNEGNCKDEEETVSHNSGGVYLQQDVGPSSYSAQQPLNDDVCGTPDKDGNPNLLNRLEGTRTGAAGEQNRAEASIGVNIQIVEQGPEECRRSPKRNNRRRRNRNRLAENQNYDNPGGDHHPENNENLDKTAGAPINDNPAEPQNNEKQASWQYRAKPSKNNPSNQVVDTVENGGNKNGDDVESQRIRNGHRVSAPAEERAPDQNEEDEEKPTHTLQFYSVGNKVEIGWFKFGEVDSDHIGLNDTGVYPVGPTDTGVYPVTHGEYVATQPLVYPAPATKPIEENRATEYAADFRAPEYDAPEPLENIPLQPIEYAGLQPIEYVAPDTVNDESPEYAVPQPMKYGAPEYALTEYGAPEYAAQMKYGAPVHPAMGNLVPVHAPLGPDAPVHPRMQFLTAAQHTHACALSSSLSSPILPLPPTFTPSSSSRPPPPNPQGRTPSSSSRLPPPSTPHVCLPPPSTSPHVCLPPPSPHGCLPPPSPSPYVCLPPPNPHICIPSSCSPPPSPQICVPSSPSRPPLPGLQFSPRLRTTMQTFTPGIDDDMFSVEYIDPHTHFYEDRTFDDGCSPIWRTMITSPMSQRSGSMVSPFHKTAPVVLDASVDRRAFINEMFSTIDAVSCVDDPVFDELGRFLDDTWWSVDYEAMSLHDASIAMKSALQVLTTRETVNQLIAEYEAAQRVGAESKGDPRMGTGKPLGSESIHF
eukprot:GHVO01021558.1.p1 GENE.GHVO01021558.1~~GHVO01021558.1.p1  ORF type:complete len:983 (+),score=133.39 GHVO01021558.1:351-2951(+)